MKGTVYLLHFDKPYYHAQHYIGWTQNVDVRIEAHLNGTGSRLVRAVVNAGIPIEIVKKWENKDRYFERSLKNQHQSRMLCPICADEKRQQITKYQRERRHRLRRENG